MESQEHQLTTILIEEVKRRIISESIPRIIKCLSKLSLQETWYRPNTETVSVGNLILHLCGNVRQWVFSGLGGVEDHRDRDSEFNEMGPIAKQLLTIHLEKLEVELIDFLDKITSEDLLKKYRVQGFEETGMAILIHVTEHFSYHTGQITYFTKTTKNIDMGYYEGQDLNQK